MKIRTDFVTNSSSSSFIIGKKEDTSVTVESVYQMIRGLYKDSYRKRNDLIQYIKDNPKIGLEYGQIENGLYNEFKFTTKNVCYEKKQKIYNFIERDFGISIYDYFSPKVEESMQSNSYEEYKKYWLNKMTNSNDFRIHAPFTIGNFYEEENITWLHYNCKEKNKPHKINSESSVLGWYYDCYPEKIVENKTCELCIDKNTCNNKQFEDSHGQKILIKNKCVPENRACLYLLGRVCVYSENGYIPYSIVEKLYEVSEYACNHMG